jgi:predicted dehydrogenase
VAAVFSDHQQLVTQLDVDLVAVTVKVPHHRELVAAALDAGKAVYCEWPLVRDLDDSRAMAALAAKQGAPTVIGLQARQALAIEFVLKLLRDGYVGEILSTTMVGLSVPGNVGGQPNAYMLDKTTGPTCSRSVTASTPSTTYWANSPTCQPCRVFADHSSPSKRPGSRS